MRTTVRLPEDLLARAKRRAQREGTTLTALITEGLRMALDLAHSRREPVKFPPVSKATGGVMPGINIIKTAELLELDNEGVAIEKLR